MRALVNRFCVHSLVLRSCAKAIVGLPAEGILRSMSSAGSDQHARDREHLRSRILESLEADGFTFEGTRLIPPDRAQKEDARAMHARALSTARERSRDGLQRAEDRLLARIADGDEVNPDRIAPRLIEVARNSEDELLFRYARLHWSIPTSSGYGRRLRFLVVDDYNDRLIGIIGLGDPVFAIADRDRWIGWDASARLQRLRFVMDAFVLGAVPPYSSLLAGKLVALLAGSNEVRCAFARKYASTHAFISGQPSGSAIALLTTVSALGRSSLYNRLRYRDDLVYQSVGFTRGTGDVHFSDGLYGDIREYASKWCTPSARNPRWGHGFRNRREVIKKCLADVGLSAEWVLHGLAREVFAAPLARNTREFLRGEDEDLAYYDRPADHLIAWFRERWLQPRAASDHRYREFVRDEYRLWPRSRQVGA